jgi:membrane fusion protein (multidrug efflux system)
MLKQITFLLPFFLLLLSCSEEEKKVAPPIEIEVTKVVQQDVFIESEYTGQTYGESDIEIAPRVTGLVQSINFKEGSLVKEGDLLYTIDPLPYQNKVDVASGSLAEAQTYLVKTKADLDMMEPLAKINAVSQRELITAKAHHEAAKGKLQSAQASLRNAQIELGYCRIVAPINGLIGISKVRVGDFVSQGPFANLNTISELKTIRVRFTISEQEYLRVQGKLRANGSDLIKSINNVHLILSDNTVYPLSGKINFADRQIDPSTGAITIEAGFDNPDKQLRSGQYVKVRLITHVEKNALLVPQRAVTEMQGIFKVFSIDDSNKVKVKIVQPGRMYKEAYIIKEGLIAGEKIALGGTSLVKNESIIKAKFTEWKPDQSSPAAGTK